MSFFKYLSLGSGYSSTAENDVESLPVLGRRVIFYLNNEKQTVTSDVSPHTRLIDYIRYKRQLSGTKVLCREGGCGACTVVATVTDTAAGSRSFSVQACQLLVYACSGWSIETIEHIGNRHDGYHPLQKTLAGFYGTQCGYCSPGMVMTMYGEQKRTGQLTKEQVEAALDGNICRCTGYRPILDAFKSLAVDAEPHLKQKLADIEDAYKDKCPKSGESCSKQCGGGCSKVIASTSSLDLKAIQSDVDIHVDAGKVQWYQPLTTRGLFSIMRRASPEGQTLLVAGNTGQGVFKHDGPYTRYISLERIAALQEISTSTSPLEIGARVSLTRCISEFIRVSAGEETAVPGYAHLAEVARHWQLVANLAVRNNGSWAGNLMLKNRHREFPSDVFVTLAACGAQIKVADVTNSSVRVLEVPELITINMSGKVIISMTLPPMDDSTHIRTYKITPRAVNAHAYVNAAIRIQLDPHDNYRVLQKPAIFFGGLGAHFMSATNTGSFLLNNQLNNVAVVHEAVRRLTTEAVPQPDPHQGSVEYRRSLVSAIFYKAVVSLLGNEVSPSLQSAGNKLQRGLNSGQQQFDLNADTWPVGQAIPKLESNIQVSGEAEYADDIQSPYGELQGAFVQTTVASAKIAAVDATAALAVPGVVTFVTASDIPGLNSFFGINPETADKVFAVDHADYAGQAVGLIVAKSRVIAIDAAKLVNITYSDRKKPVLTIKEGIKKGRNTMPFDFMTGKPGEMHIKDGLPHDETFDSSSNHISGELDIGTQFHMPMEPLCAIVTPMEDGYNVVCSTQHINETQSVLSRLLNIPANSINLEVRRIGGAFGGKISRCNVVSGAAAVAAAKTKKPVRINLDLKTHMTLVGWREPYHVKYEVGFENTGKLEAVKIELYTDTGYTNNESSAFIASANAKNVYHSKAWDIKAEDVITDTAANTWCRTPGTVEGVAAIENIIEHIACYLKKDPLEVRMVNLSPDLSPEKGGANGFKNSILPLLKEKCGYDLRKQQVVEFNKANRWRKRGLSLVPLRYGMSYPPMFRYTAQVAIYEHDGTIAITHGGIEMGQGINTKVAQVAAKVLGVPLSLIKIKPTSSVSGANSQVTGGSFGTDLVCHGIRICCERLHLRIETVRKAFADKPMQWPQLIKTCLNMDVDLMERYWTAGREHPSGYTVWAGACMEVELDVLTGQYVIRHTDIVEDTGNSMSPFVDIGQVEGAFVMGLGMFTSEYLQFDEDTGEKLVTGTWDYKPPLAMDIPEDLRVTFLPNAPNPYGVMRSKATGEPPLCLSYCVVTALRAAVAAAREHAKGIKDWFEMHTPLTVERLQKLCLVDPEHFVLKV